MGVMVSTVRWEKTKSPKQNKELSSQFTRIAKSLGFESCEVTNRFVDYTSVSCNMGSSVSWFLSDPQKHGEMWLRACKSYLRENEYDLSPEDLTLDVCTYFYTPSLRT